MATRRFIKNINEFAVETGLNPILVICEDSLIPPRLKNMSIRIGASAITGNRASLRRGCVVP